MQKAIDLYRPDMDQNTSYQSAKHTLIESVTSTTALLPRVNDDSGALLERLERGDIDDNESALWICFCAEREDDDWWLDEIELRISLLCMSLRNHRHPEVRPTSLLIDQPEFTTHFHHNLKYSEKLSVIEVMFGGIAHAISLELNPPQEPRMQTILDERYDVLRREIWDDSAPKRTRFDLL